MLEKIRKHTNIKSQIVFAMESTAHYWLALFTRLRKDGYHVILRMPIQGDDLVMSSDGSRQTLQMLVAQDQLGSLLTGWVDEADISWEPKFRSIDYAAVFTPKQSFWKRLDVFDWFEK